MKTFYHRMEYDPNWNRKNSQWMTHRVLVDHLNNYCGCLPGAGRFTIIAANGSKWMGEDPEPIEALYHMLDTEPLDPKFEEYGNFVHPKAMYTDQPGFMKFWGNFANISH